MRSAVPFPRLAPLTLYSVVIPAHNEEESLPHTVTGIYQTLLRENVPHEIVVVDDGSKDRTWAVLQELRQTVPTLAPVQNLGPHGFGRAVIFGLNSLKGDACVIMMADASDSPDDAVKYWRLLNEGWECVFGSRFIKGGRVVDYPRFKLFVNRVANFWVRVGFNIPLNDTTNAFKAYRRTVIEGCRPYLSPHFNLTACPSSRSARWAAGIFSSAPTSGSKNISAAAIIGNADPSLAMKFSRQFAIRAPGPHRQP
jgi:dolichol-phosphate mannosyltransferase